MDPKAAAKSKRSQTQHGRRNHPTCSAAAIAAEKKKPPPQQPQQKQQPGGEQRSRRALQHLPSNWDRYEDGDGDGIVEEVEGRVGLRSEKGTAKRAAVEDGGDVVAPKSKGADFGYLIEHARSQPQDYGGRSLGSATMFDDTLPDFLQGSSPILSVRGKNLLSRCGDENFIVDDDETSNFEVPFLSMDLDALAAKLAKLSMAQRLFIEADLLPDELDISPLNESGTQAFEHVETLNTSESQHSLVQVAYHAHADTDKNASDLSDAGHSQAVEGDNSLTRAGKEVPQSTFRQGTMASPMGYLESLNRNRLGGVQESSPMGYLESLNRNRLRGVQESIQQFNMYTDADLNKASRFEAATAEADLDMLLDSFSETNPSDSSSAGGSSSYSYATQHVPYGHSAEIGARATSVRKESSSSQHVSTTVSLEDTIDDLLAETKFLSPSGYGGRFSNSSIIQPMFQSAHMGIVASRQGPISSREAATNISLVDTIDDLLAEAKFLGSYGTGDVLNTSAVTQPESHGSSIRKDVPPLRQESLSRHMASTLSLDDTIDDLLADT